MGLLSGLDMDKISDILSSMKKVLNILAEVTKKDDDIDLTKRKRGEKSFHYLYLGLLFK